MFAPARIFRPSLESVSYCRTMLRGIEILPIVFPVVQANMLRRRHPLNIRRSVVSSIKIHVMAMGPRSFAVNLVPKVPLIRQSMSWIKMTVDRLIHRLVAPHQVPIQRHQRISGTKGVCLDHAPITLHEEVIGRHLNALAIVQLDLK